MNRLSSTSRQPKRNLANWLTAAISLAVLASGLIGCDDDNRKPTQTEVKAADVKRQAYIDSLNIPPEQKAAMKSHMGGPAVANPADAARQGHGGANARTQ